MATTGPVAGNQRKHRPHCRVEGRHLVTLLRRRHARRPLIVALDHHHPAHRLHMEVQSPVSAVRAVEAERGQRDVDKPGIGAAQHVGAQAKRLQTTLWVGLDQHVRHRHELFERRQAVLRLEVDDHSPLVGVEVREDQAPLEVPDPGGEGGEAPRRVAPRRFHLDHIRADVGKEPANVLALYAREIDHAESGQGSWHMCHLGGCGKRPIGKVFKQRLEPLRLEWHGR